MEMPRLYDGTLGLSCVENQILALLLEQGQDIVPLYYDSAVPIKILCNDLLTGGQRAERYHGVDRVQTTLQRLGIVKMERSATPFEELSTQMDRMETLLKVSSAFTFHTLHARGFREDHFVLVRREADFYRAYNDIPAASIPLYPSELKRAYDGEVITVSIQRTLTQEDAATLFQQRTYKPEDWELYALPDGLAESISDFGQKFSQLLRVYKILRRRMQAYYKKYISGYVIPVREIEKLQARLEYCNLRDGRDQSKRILQFQELVEMDNHLMSVCKKEMEGVIAWEMAL